MGAKLQESRTYDMLYGCVPQDASQMPRMCKPYTATICFTYVLRVVGWNEMPIYQLDDLAHPINLTY